MELADVLSKAFANVNWLAVVVGTLAGFAVGSIWYHEKVLGSRWMKQVGLKTKDIESANMARTFGGSFVLMFLQAVLLAVFVRITGVETAFDGALLGLLVGLFFAATSTGINYLYSQRSFELYWIDAGYHVLNITIAGLVLGWLA